MDTTVLRLRSFERISFNSKALVEVSSRNKNDLKFFEPNFRSAEAPQGSIWPWRYNLPPAFPSHIHCFANRLCLIWYLVYFYFSFILSTLLLLRHGESVVWRAGTTITAAATLRNDTNSCLATGTFTNWRRGATYIKKLHSWCDTARRRAVVSFGAVCIAHSSPANWRAMRHSSHQSTWYWHHQ